MNIKQKLTSKVVWVTIIPLIAHLIAMFTSQAYADQFADIGMTVVSVLAVVGILNNPDSRENF